MVKSEIDVFNVFSFGCLLGSEKAKSQAYSGSLFCLCIYCCTIQFFVQLILICYKIIVKYTIIWMHKQKMYELGMLDNKIIYFGFMK